MYRLLLLLFVLLLPSPPAAAQELELVQNRAFQVTYAVPPHWPLTHQRTDSVEVLRYQSPDDDARLWVGQPRGRHPHDP